VIRRTYEVFLGHRIDGYDYLKQEKLTEPIPNPNLTLTVTINKLIPTASFLVFE